jgi:hypothetical protein
MAAALFLVPPPIETDQLCFCCFEMHPPDRMTQCYDCGEVHCSDPDPSSLCQQMCSCDRREKRARMEAGEQD